MLDVSKASGTLNHYVQRTDEQVRSRKIVVGFQMLDVSETSEVPNNYVQSTREQMLALGC